jgi:DNA repair photolyase
MEERIEAMKIIRANNINLIAYISPVFPYLTNESEILEKLNGIVKNVYFENYNIKLGNWDEVKTKLDKKLLEVYDKIFFNKAEYENFWQNFIKSVENLNKKFNFNIKFFIYPFNSYY